MGAESLYTSMAGLQAITAQMQANASNLANLQTPGYAAIEAETEAAPYAGANAPPGATAVAVNPAPDTIAGPLTHTGDPMTVGIGGNAWLEVQNGGAVALTRDGNLQITSAGILADSAGNPILGAGGQPISLPMLAKLEIGTDGTISGVPAATPGAPTQSFGKIALVTAPPGLSSLGGSLFAPPAGTTPTPSAGGSLHQGYLNGSNADPTQSMMQLIADSRSYQIQANLMKMQGSGGDALNLLLSQG